MEEWAAISPREEIRGRVRELLDEINRLGEASKKLLEALKVERKAREHGNECPSRDYTCVCGALDAQMRIDAVLEEYENAGL